ncbi:MAG: DUF4190 domain-containing protein [Acidobacteriota bacterium]|nr:DUF4190 domain-containing protein [Acidobacteriota bacterium]
MYCNTCGAANEDKANFCVNCGSRLLAQTVVVNPAQVMAGAATPPPSPQIPPAQMPPAVLTPSQPAAAAWQPGAPQAPQTSGKAVASLILGIANGLFLFFFFPLAILAIVFGHISRSEIAKSAGRLKGAGMALAGLILGYASLTIFPLLIIAAIAIPNLLSARQSANESSAVSSMRTINTAAVTYMASYPDKGYPPSLETLGTAQFIDSELATGEKRGYRFTYTPIDANGDGVNESYVLNADPVTPGTTGRRHFFSDDTGIIRYDTAQMATKESQPLQ